VKLPRLPFWPRRRKDDEPPRWDELLPVEALLRAEVEDVLAIEQRQLWGRSVAFGGRLRVPPGAAVDRLRARLEVQGYTPFLREDRGTAWVYALPGTQLAAPVNPWINVGLFVLTVLTTLLAGAWPMGGVPPGDLVADPRRLVVGVPFAASLLSILVVHEFGHYTFGRRHGMPITLPYFIPAPPPLFPIGTLGAVIRLRGPVRDRRALFDMAVAGPLAGLLLALPILVYGLSRSVVVPLPPASQGVLEFGDSLLLMAMQWLVVGPLPANTVVELDPVGVAGWFGLFVTALNLIPAGQLDGGHLVYALFGARHRLISKLTVVGLLAIGLAFGSVTWLFWAVLIVGLIGFQHAPPMDDITPLDGRRRALGLFALALIVLLLPPVPLTIR
jgi:membrane-associated protease RseP (regulator of RpoE activity)